jgi:hypothetical protein
MTVELMRQLLGIAQARKARRRLIDSIHLCGPAKSFILVEENPEAQV